MCIFVRISVYFVYLGLVIGIVFYKVPCIHFVLFFCVLHNVDFICSTCIVSGQSALMHFNKWKWSRTKQVTESAKYTWKCVKIDRDKWNGFTAKTVSWARQKGIPSDQILIKTHITKPRDWNHFTVWQPEAESSIPPNTTTFTFWFLQNDSPATKLGDVIFRLNFSFKLGSRANQWAV